jgi:hypothetical protein
MSVGRGGGGRKRDTYQVLEYRGGVCDHLLTISLSCLLDLSVFEWNTEKKRDESSSGGRTNHKGFFSMSVGSSSNVEEREIVESGRLDYKENNGLHHSAICSTWTLCTRWRGRGQDQVSSRAKQFLSKIKKTGKINKKKISGGIGERNDRINQGNI